MTMENPSANPFEKSKQQHEKAVAEVPSGMTHYGLDNHSNIVWGHSKEDVARRVLEANQGYS